MRPYVLISAICYLFLTACGGISAEVSRLTDEFEPWGFTVAQKRYGQFDLRESIKQGTPDNPVWIVYAGDGLAWLDAWTPSPDPTPSVYEMPSVQVALALVKLFPSDTVIHLTRPCQFLETNAQSCGTQYWTKNRFGTTVRQAYKQHATKFNNRPVIFVGWSGGGVIAAHMAHQRTNISRQTGLLTMASPLDLAAWTKWHQVSPLPRLDNPALFLPLALPHAYGVGQTDRIVPPETVMHLPDQIPVAMMDHHGPWQEFASQFAPSIRRDVIAAQP